MSPEGSIPDAARMIPDDPAMLKTVMGLIDEFEKFPNSHYVMRFTAPSVIDVVWYDPTKPYSTAVRTIHAMLESGGTLHEHQLVRVHGNRIGMVGVGKEVAEKTGVILGTNVGDKAEAVNFTDYPPSAFMNFTATNGTRYDLCVSNVDTKPIEYMNPPTWSGFLNAFINSNYTTPYTKTEVMSTIRRHAARMTDEQRRQLGAHNPHFAVPVPSKAPVGVVLVHNDLHEPDVPSWRDSSRD